MRGVFGRVFALEELRDALSAFDKSAWQEDNHEHEDNAEGQVPAFADERVDQRDDEVFKPIGQEGKPCVQDV